MLMLEWLAGWFLCVSVLAVVLLYLEVSCWLCCLYAHLNFMSRLNFVGGPMCWNTRTFSASAGMDVTDYLLQSCFVYYVFVNYLCGQLVFQVARPSVMDRQAMLAKLIG